MALLLPRSIFLHIPKTGGSWVRRAVANAGIPTNEVVRSLDVADETVNQIVHCFARQVEPQGRFLFAFVRHPLAVYRSYWAFKMAHGAERRGHIDRVFCQHAAFPDFVEHMLRKRPGWVSQLYRDYLGDAGEAVDFVGRQESLADDLVCALRLAGEEFDERCLRATPPVNQVSELPQWSERCRFPRDLHDAVLASEQFACERFGYGPLMSDFVCSGVDRSSSGRPIA